MEQQLDLVDRRPGRLFDAARCSNSGRSVASALSKVAAEKLALRAFGATGLNVNAYWLAQSFSSNSAMPAENMPAPDA